MPLVDVLRAQLLQLHIAEVRRHLMRGHRLGLEHDAADAIGLMAIAPASTRRFQIVYPRIGIA